MRAGRDDEAVVGGGQGIGLVAGLGQRAGVFLVPHVGEALVEEQGKDVLLVVARVDQPAEDGGRAPEVGFEFLLGHAFSASSHPPSFITRRKFVFRLAARGPARP